MRTVARMVAWIAAAAAVAGNVAFAAPITSVPGYSGELPRMESGYIDVSGGAPVGKRDFLFYWFTELWNDAMTVDDSTPITLWLSGGPGCSSCFGAMYEMGPFRVREIGPQPDAQVVLDRWQWSWVNHSAMLWVESPVGVGFSYSENANYTSGDLLQAEALKQFLDGFFVEFPEFANRPLYLAGESYAGHYVPTLASALLADARYDPTQGGRLKGLSMGNPSFDHTDGTSYFDLLASHAIVSLDLWAAANEACNTTAIQTDGADPKGNCSALREQMHQLAVGVDPYDILTACVGEPSLNGGCLTGMTSYLAKSPHTSPYGAPGLESQTFVPCTNVTPSVAYFRRPDVLKAFNVRSESLQWDVCSQVLNYGGFLPSMAPYYEAALRKTLRIWVYSGSSDACVPFLDTQRSMDAVADALGGIKQEWNKWYTPWTSAQGFPSCPPPTDLGLQIAGYFKVFTPVAPSEDPYQFVFSTVRGAGHMVPTFRPEQSFHLFHRFLTAGAGPNSTTLAM